VSKATGVPLAKVAARVMAGLSLEEAGLAKEPALSGSFVKEAVLPFRKLPGSDARLGPEMHSTGEVMGHASDFPHAFAKATIGAGDELPNGGTVLISVNDGDKRYVVDLAKRFCDLGFTLLATRGTAAYLQRHGVAVQAINKVAEGSPHVVDYIREGRIAIAVNTPIGSVAHEDGIDIRRNALRQRVLLLTTMKAAFAAVEAITALGTSGFAIESLQEHYRKSTCEAATAPSAGM
ncbi:MAG: carbamoyl phosphate synthase large subunit, partial [Chloroflexi bacterium]|nr:carbamoyl phosphate synthase large subunit [Chloroflexota bacterium]